MSISFNSYIRTAQLADGGKIRGSAEDPTQLVNKGTVGHGLATMFRNISEALGIVAQDETRAERQEAALTGFRDAIREQFGTAIGDAALRQAGLDQDGVTLTGAKVLEAADAAKALLRENERATRSLAENYRMPDPGGTPPRLLANVALSLARPIDLDDLWPGAREVYNERFERALTSALEQGRNRLDDAAITQISRQVLGEVAALQRTQGLGASEVARQGFEASVRSLLTALAHDVGPEQLAEALERVVDRHAAYTATRPEGFAGTLESDLDNALRNELRGLNLMDREILPKAQAHALAEGSPLAALRLAVRDLKREQATGDNEHRRLDAVVKVAARLADALALGLGPLTGRREGDLARLTARGDDRHDAEATTAMRGVMRNAPPDPPGPADRELARFLEAVREGGPSDRAARRNFVEAHVVAREGDQPPVSRQAALDKLARSLARTGDVPAELRTGLEAAIRRSREATNTEIMLERLVARRLAGEELDYGQVIADHLAEGSRGGNAAPQLNKFLGALVRAERGRGEVFDEVVKGLLDAVTQVLGPIRLEKLEADRGDLLEKTATVVDTALAREGFTLEESAAGLVRSFLTYAQPLFGTPGEALEALAERLAELPDTESRQAVLAALAEEKERRIGDWPEPEFDRQGKQTFVSGFAEAMLPKITPTHEEIEAADGEYPREKQQDTIPMEGPPEQRVAFYLGQAQRIFATPGEALDLLQAYLQGRRFVDEGLKADLLGAVARARENGTAWPD